MRLPRHASYTISLHSELGAFQLAKAWCHTLQFLFDESQRGAGGVVDFAEALARYEEPVEFARWAAVATGRALNRIGELRGLVPKPP